MSYILINLVDLIPQFFIPIFSLIVSIIALRSGWIYSSDRIFSQRSELSKFSYALYKQFEDENLKKVAKEYGYAALTRDKGLNIEQRLVLLSSTDPVTDIDKYSKCANYLSVNVNTRNGKFSWIRKRYKYKFYRGIVKLFLTILYFAGCVMLISPLLAPTLFGNDIINKFNVLLSWEKIAVVSYIVISGGFIAFMALNKASKLNMAVRLIKNNRK
ncbi:hypothetical protein PT273_05570 [Orbaceae bacterium ESL0727]|nr:hypothetical protein [Orbaceae bacterium ESL0727]